MANIKILYQVKCEYCQKGDFELFLMEDMNVRALCTSCLNSIDLKMADETKKIRFPWNDYDDDSEGGLISEE